MENVEADNNDFDLNDIVQTISGSTVYAHLISHWYTLALHLKTEDTLKDTLNQKKILGTIQSEQLLVELFQEWKSRCGEKANYMELHVVLKACAFNDVAHVIEKKYLYPNGAKKGEENKGIEILKKEHTELYDHFMYYMVDLLDRTYLCDELLDKMEREGIISGGDVVELKDMLDREDRNRTFFRMVMERIPENQEIYDLLIQAFKKDQHNYKTGVSYLLNKYYD